MYEFERVLEGSKSYKDCFRQTDARRTRIAVLLALSQVFTGISFIIGYVPSLPLHEALPLFPFCVISAENRHVPKIWRGLLHSFRRQPALPYYSHHLCLRPRWVTCGISTSALVRATNSALDRANRVRSLHASLRHYRRC